MFTSLDSNYSTLSRVEKRVQMRGNVCGMSSNHGGDIYRVMENEV
jgi:hypothetical protein